MRTHIAIGEASMAQAIEAGPLETEKQAVEAGSKRLARQAAPRETLKGQGRLEWAGDQSIDRTRPARDVAASRAGPARDRARGRHRAGR